MRWSSASCISSPASASRERNRRRARHAASTGGHCMNSTWTIVSALLALLSVAICGVALFVVPVNRKPSSATAWLMLIFGLPFFGAILFLLLGSPKLSRRRRAQQRSMDDVLHKAVID